MNTFKALSTSILIGYFVFFSPDNLFAKEKAPIITISSIKGEAWYYADSTPKQKTEIKSGDKLMESGTIMTAPSGEVKIMLGEKSAAILIKKRSHLQIKQSPAGEWELELKEGLLLNAIKQVPTNKPNFYRVRARGVVMGVRGTTFFVKLDPDKSLFLCACQGKLSIGGESVKDSMEDKSTHDSKTTLAKNEVVVESKYHDFHKTILPGGDAVSKRLKEAPQGDDHTDPEAASLAELLK